MKIALATTTIHVPHALKLLRKCSADVKFFVALDSKSPVDAILREFDIYDPSFVLLTTENQERWKCSLPIGWNTIARRNIAFLEALKWGADIIVSWDDDNIPVSKEYFTQFDSVLHTFGGYGHGFKAASFFNGIKISSHDRWFDPGQLLIPRTRHRGFPCALPAVQAAGPATDVKVGVAAGLVIGDPDIDATTRIEKSPDIGSVHILGSAGVVVDPNIWTVFNSQNTAVIRELIPAWFMMPGVGRHDDIYASLIVQRVARERNYHVHFGPPFTYQQRNPHNLIKDLRAEIDGMENVIKLAEFLDGLSLPGKSAVEDTCIIYSALRYCDFLPLASVDAGLAWVEDVGGIL